MTLSQWLHFQQLIAHYEEEVARSHIIAAGGFAMMGLMFLLMIFLACMKVTIWWIGLIPAFAFLCLGIVGMTNATNARDMIESIKWRMI